MGEILNHHNSKEVWNGEEWVRVALCDNAVKNTSVNFGRGIGIYQCYDNEQKFVVTIGYRNCIGGIFDQSTVSLCNECLGQLKKSARGRGYKLKVETIRKKE